MAISIKKHWKILGSFTRTTFGISANLEEPDDADLVIICKNEGGGLIPISIMLPHQLYKKDLSEILREIGSPYHGEVLALPVRSKEYITIAKVKHAA